MTKLDVIRVNGAAREGVARLLGRLDASIKHPDIAMSLPEIRDVLEAIQTAIRAADNMLFDVRLRDD